MFVTLELSTRWFDFDDSFLIFLLYIFFFESLFFHCSLFQIGPVMDLVCFVKIFDYLYIKYCHSKVRGFSNIPNNQH